MNKLSAGNMPASEVARRRAVWTSPGFRGAVLPRGWFMALGLAMAVAASPAAAGPTPDQKCRATKLKASGKYAGAALGCASKAAKSGAATDPACLSKGYNKFAVTFDSAESKNAVDCNGETATTGASIDAGASAIDAASPVPGGGAKCPAALRKAGGKLASSLLGAWSKFVTKGDASARDAALDKANAAFDKAAAKAEGFADCTGSNQGAAVRAAVEAHVAPIVACIVEGSCGEIVLEGCPGSMRWRMLADDGVNDRASELDIGWTGNLHNLDPASGSTLRLTLDCIDETEESCGVCGISGFDPAEGNCRCENDSRTTCDEPGASDMNDCGGAACRCHTQAPLAFGASIPLCLVISSASDAAGAWAPDTGQGQVILDERARIFSGISQLAPCPTCVGDPVSRDGLRGGTCSGGASNGLSCDAHGSDPSFPYPGGGATSLDCMPIPGASIAGEGLRISRTETTGPVSLSSSLPCFGYDLMASCHCAVCSGNDLLACSNDTQCADAAAGTCTSLGGGSAIRPHGCSVGGCDVDGNGEGECASSFQSYCDGIVDEDGRGVIGCSSDFECDFFDAGQCDLPQARNCFGPTIEAVGQAAPTSPRTVATACIPASSNGTVNSLVGLPGPARTRSDWNVTYLP